METVIAIGSAALTVIVLLACLELRPVAAVRWWVYGSSIGVVALVLESLVIALPGSAITTILRSAAMAAGCAQICFIWRGVLCLQGSRRSWTVATLAFGLCWLIALAVVSLFSHSGPNSFGAVLGLVIPITCGVLASHLWAVRGAGSRAAGTLVALLALAFLVMVLDRTGVAGAICGALGISAPPSSASASIAQLLVNLTLVYLAIHATRQWDEEVHLRYARLQDMVDAADCGLCELDELGRFTFINAAASNILGSAGGVLQSPVSIDERLHPRTEEARRALSTFILRPITGLAACTFGVHPEAESGTCAACTVVPVVRDGSVARLVMTVRDVTPEQASSRLLQTRADLLEMIARNRPVDEVLKALVVAVEARLADANCTLVVSDGESYTVLAGERVPESLRASLDALPSGPAGLACEQQTRWENSLRSVVRSHGFSGTWIEPLVSSAHELFGAIILNRVTAAGPNAAEFDTLKDAAHIAALAIEHRRGLERLQHQGYHDALTGLPNRLLFSDRLKHALARAQRTGRRLALMCIDLDRFKQINDTLGHDLGDLFLRQISVRLASRIRSSDTMARTGGDEFMAIIDDVRDRGDAEAVGNSLRAALDDPFELDGHTLYGSASIGIALYPQDGRDADTLQRNADRAMYRAKALGKNTVQSSSSADVDDKGDPIDIEVHLHRALEQGKFSLHFQPQFTCDRQLSGFEALLRFRHPKLGMVPPSRFIPIAEESGLILPIGKWVLHEACRQVAEWRSKGMAPIRVAVNVSPLQFARSDFSETVARALKSANIRPELLELEVTEGVLMSRVNGSERQMDVIAKQGVRLSVDDFGTGYSSLSYLHQLPIQMLKIDRSFVEKITEPCGTRSIVEAIISLAHALGMQTVAEGVETEEQFAVLQTLRCDLIQGFLLSRPLPAIEASRLLWHETIVEHGGPLVQEPSALPNAAGRPLPAAAWRSLKQFHRA